MPLFHTAADTCRFIADVMLLISDTMIDTSRHFHAAALIRCPPPLFLSRLSPYAATLIILPDDEEMPLIMFLRRHFTMLRATRRYTALWRCARCRACMPRHAAAPFCRLRIDVPSLICWRATPPARARDAAR